MTTVEVWTDQICQQGGNTMNLEEDRKRSVSFLQDAIERALRRHDPTKGIEQEGAPICSVCHEEYQGEECPCRMAS